MLHLLATQSVIVPDQPALLILAVVAVGVLHTMVPDHWAPIALLARQHGWSNERTARAAAIAGLGHTVSTLIIAAVVWFAGVALAVRFGHAVAMLSSLLLIAFGAWIAIGSWRDITKHADHVHSNFGHAHAHETSSRTALLLILGSSPMVEGVPAFFAASRYGAGLLGIMALLFGVSTIATYVALCVASASGIQRVNLGRFEQYGEVISGSFIALIGLLFLIFPSL
jgi:hypothetical protein